MVTAPNDGAHEGYGPLLQCRACPQALLLRRLLKRYYSTNARKEATRRRQTNKSEDCYLDYRWEMPNCDGESGAEESKG